MGTSRSLLWIGLPVILGLAAAALLLAALGPQTAQAAGTVGDGSPGSCTESELLAALDGGGLVTFNCGPNPHTITLTARYQVTAPTTIDGGGLITLSGGGLNGILGVDEGTALYLHNLTLADGYDEGGGGAVFNSGTLVVSNTTFISNTTAGIDDGGAIYNLAVLTVTSSAFYSNTATDGGAIYSNLDLEPPVTPSVFITGSLFQGNVATHEGGAVLADDSDLFHLARSIFRGNYSDGAGGAVGVEDAVEALIEHSLFENNAAYEVGGAVFAAESGRVRVEAATFSGNEVLDLGGALFSDLVAAVEVSASTFFNNQAIDGGGGAVAAGNGALTLTHSSVHSNSAFIGGGVLGGPGSTLYLAHVEVYSNAAGFFGGGLASAGAETTALAGSRAAAARGPALGEALARLASSGAFYSGPASSQAAGGGLAPTASLSLIDSRVYSNTAGFGGGLTGVPGSELYLARVDIFANVTDESGAGLTIAGGAVLDDVDVRHNTVLGPGGWGAGVDVDGFPEQAITLNNVRVWANTLIGGHPDYAGAGVAAAGSPITIANSAIYSNTLIQGSGGGGLHASWETDVTLSNTAIYSNTALAGRGGGVESSSVGGGASVRLINTTLSGNYAPEGGAVYNDPLNPALLMTHVSVVSNTSGTGGSLAGDLTLANSLVALNAPLNCSSGLGSGGYNLENTNTCGLASPGDVPNTDPWIRPLGYHGGPNPANLVHALLVGSAAIDTAANAACPAGDQRGVGRPLDGTGDGAAACDKGAFEFDSQVLRLFVPLLMRGQ